MSHSTHLLQQSAISSNNSQHNTATLLERVWSTLELWIQRAKQRRQLLGLNEHQLKDIGISAASAIREGNKPFWKH